MRARAFFSPSLAPVLDRGKRHKHPVVAPQVPPRRAIGHTAFDHDADRQIDHPVGILTARRRQIREVGAKVRATLRTVVLRIGDHEIPRTPQIEIPQVVQRPLVLLVPIGPVTTPRTRLARVGTMRRDDLWRWQVGNRGDPFGGIGSIHPRTEHGCVLRACMSRPALYDKCPSGAIPKPGTDAIVSRNETVSRKRYTRTIIFSFDTRPSVAL